MAQSEQKQKQKTINHKKRLMYRLNLSWLNHSNGVCTRSVIINFMARRLLTSLWSLWSFICDRSNTEKICPKISVTSYCGDDG